MEELHYKITEYFSQGENEKLIAFLEKGLSGIRDNFLKELDDFIHEIDGKVRLKVLEILMTDGGADLIPLFIESITREKNLLYAKSMILMFRDFKHQQALTSLLSIENEVPADLRGTYQRTLGRLLSQFSEQFYMGEFRAGRDDYRRVKFAADMMLRSPHPEYGPFLNEVIKINDRGFRFEGLRAMEALADDQSTKALFDLISLLRKQRKKFQAFTSLIFGTKELVPLFEGLCELCASHWNKERKSQFLEKVKLHEFDEFCDLVLSNLDLFAELIPKLKPYLIELLACREPSQFLETRTHSLVSDYGEDLDSLIHRAATLLGDLSQRKGDQDFLKNMEFYLPIDEPQRDELLISAFSGYRNDEAYELLVEYVNTCDDNGLLSRALEGLQAFDGKEVPSGVERLCFDEKEHQLRLKSLQLMAKWGRATPVLKQLFEHSSIAVRADAIRTAAEYEIADIYPLILKVLRPGVPDSLLIAALEALRRFDRSHTGKTAKPFILQPHTISVRRAAFRTIYEAGGPDRIDILLRAFEQNKLSKIGEMLNEFLTHALSKDFEALEQDLLKHRDLWLKLLNEDDGDISKKVLQLIERLPINEEFLAKTWLHGLSKILNQFEGSTVSEKEQRIGVLVEKYEKLIQNHKDATQRLKSMEAIMSGLDSNNLYHKAQALRKLTQSYKDSWIDNNPSAIRTLVEKISTILADHSLSPEFISQAISVVGKVRHPKLRGKVAKLADFPNVSVRNAVKMALAEPVDPRFLKPIRSIFVMDDSRYITKQLSKVLAEHGFTVDFENDVRKGMATLTKKSFDLLILDYIMPELDGIQFLEAAREQEIAPDHTIIITSTRNKEDLRPFINQGIDGLLLKPFRMDEMLTRIKEVSPAGL